MVDEGAIGATLDALIAGLPDPRGGLPEAVFDFVRRVTPLVNVDLLVRDDAGRTLLSWREDAFYRGWHVPGGIIRFRETAHQRVAAVARAELGTSVTPTDSPCDLIQANDARGHFISLLFPCTLTAAIGMDFAPAVGPRRAGMLRWFDAVPDDLIPTQRHYARWFAPQTSTSRPQV